MADPVCNCPPLSDVLRGRAGGTTEPCPVHDTPEMRAMLKDLVPARPFPGTASPFRALAAHDRASWDPVAEPLSSRNSAGYGTGC